MGQEVTDPVLLDIIPFCGRAPNGDIMPGKLRGFMDDLPTPTARPHWVGAGNGALPDQAADDGNLADLPQFPLCVDRRKCDSFRAQSQPVARIFKIASADNGFIIEQNGRTNAEAGLGGVCILCRSASGGDQAGFGVGHGRTTDHPVVPVNPSTARAGFARHMIHGRSP